MLGFWLILVAIAAGNALWWRWADKRLRPLQLARLWRSLLALFIALQLAYLFAFVIAPEPARRAHFYVPESLLAIVYLWGVLVLPITGLVTLLITAGRWIFSRFSSSAKPPAPTIAVPPSTGNPSTLDLVRLSRRQMLSAAAVAVPPLLTGIGVVYGRRSLFDLHVNHVDIAIPNLPEDLVGVSFAHISDCHVGKFVRERHLNQAAEMANSLNADLHLLTGDLIDLSIADLPLALDFVARLKPNHGLIMCEGNHDLLDDATAFYAGVKARNVPLLANDRMALRLPKRSTPINLLGLKWARRAETYPAEWIRGLAGPRDPGAGLPILLAHHPDTFDAAAEAGIPLTLSGHTHGGLLMLSETVGPGPLLYRYWSGLYRKQSSALYVSNGVGTWFPLRTHARPEIAHLTLRRA